MTTLTPKIKRRLEIQGFTYADPGGRTGQHHTFLYPLADLQDYLRVSAKDRGRRGSDVQNGYAVPQVKDRNREVLKDFCRIQCQCFSSLG